MLSARVMQFNFDVAAFIEETSKERKKHKKDESKAEKIERLSLVRNMRIFV